MAYLNTCTMLFVQWGQESSPYWSIKKPHLFPAPHGSVICRKARKHIVFPLSCTESWFSHQNITFSSFQLIKGQLDISLLHQSLLSSWNGACKGLGPKDTFTRNKRFYNPCLWRRNLKKKQKSSLKCVSLCNWIWFSQHRSTQTGKVKHAWKNVNIPISISISISTCICVYISMYIQEERECRYTQVHTPRVIFLSFSYVLYISYTLYLCRKE